jgi:hypothetical protein
LDYYCPRQQLAVIAFNHHHYDGVNIILNGTKLPAMEKGTTLISFETKSEKLLVETVEEFERALLVTDLKTISLDIYLESAIAAFNTNVVYCLMTYIETCDYRKLKKAWNSNLEILQTLFHKFPAELKLSASTVQITDISIATWAISIYPRVINHMNNLLKNIENIIELSYVSELIFPKAISLAILSNDMNMIQTLHEEYNVTWEDDMFVKAVTGRHLKIAKYMYENDPCYDLTHEYSNQSKKMIDFIEEIGHTWECTEFTGIASLQMTINHDIDITEEYVSSAIENNSAEAISCLYEHSLLDDSRLEDYIQEASMVDLNSSGGEYHEYTGSVLETLKQIFDPSYEPINNNPYEQDPYEYENDFNPVDMINGTDKIRHWYENQGAYSELVNMEESTLPLYMEQRESILIY